MDRRSLLAAASPQPTASKVYVSQVGSTRPSSRVAVDSTKAAESERLANFLKELVPTAFEGMDLYKESEIKRGMASLKRANASDAQKFADAIKRGDIGESESPYFREGVYRAYTSTLLSRYNEGLFEAWEQSDVKYDNNEGALEAFMNDYDSKFAEEHFTNIPDEVLADIFLPGSNGVRRQLSQEHTAFQRGVYREESYNTLENSYYTYMQGVLFDDLAKSGFLYANSDAPFADPQKRTQNFSLLQKREITAATEAKDAIDRSYSELQTAIRKGTRFSVSPELKRVLSKDNDGKDLLKAINAYNASVSSNRAGK